MVEWHIPGVASQSNQFNWVEYYCAGNWDCPYCNGNHNAEGCPRVEEIEYYPNGAIKRVKLR